MARNADGRVGLEPACLLLHRVCGLADFNSPLKNAIAVFLNLAKFGAKLLTGRKITTYVVILASPPGDAPAC